jgi:hypothetical protein
VSTAGGGICAFFHKVPRQSPLSLGSKRFSGGAGVSEWIDFVAIFEYVSYAQFSGNGGIYGLMRIETAQLYHVRAVELSAFPRCREYLPALGSF